MPADSITIEAPPRTEASANGHGSAERTRKKRMLIIVNPYATTVSDRLKNLVVYALQGRYDVEAVSTEAQHHAIEIGREAREGGYDVVVAFGGDGTLNEVANGLAGTDVPVSVLPGGSTNVVCRTLGIPNDVVDATEHLLGHRRRLPAPQDRPGARQRPPFRVRLRRGPRRDRGQAGGLQPAAEGPGRALVLHLGGGLRLLQALPPEPDPDAPRRPTAASAEGVTAIVQNSDPFTYFGSQPLRVCEGAALDNGTLSVAMLGRAAQRDVPTIAARVLLDGLRASGHRQIAHYEGVTEGRIESVSRDAGGGHPPLPGPGGRGLHRRSRRARDRHRARRADDRCLSRRPVTDGCRFCAIVAGDEAGHVVFEDESSLAFLDHRPLFPGHSLLVPRDHHETIWDLPDGLLSTLFANARVLSAAIRVGDGRPGRVHRPQQRGQPERPPRPRAPGPAKPQGRAARVLLAAAEVRERGARRSRPPRRSARRCESWVGRSITRARSSTSE